MHSLMQHHMANAIAFAMRDAAQSRRHSRRTAEPEQVVIRSAREADAPALDALAHLDGTRSTRRRLISALHDGGVVLAEVDGAVRAALPVTGGRPVADPFVPSAGLADLLRLRAGQLRRAA
jgi:hypothetical protein